MPLNPPPRLVLKSRSIVLQGYRLAVLVAIVLTMHAHHLRLRIEGDAPITLAEVKGLLPAAERLLPDPGERRGFQVEDGHGKRIGYVLRTMPDARTIVGYRGPTDTLVVFDAALHVVGVGLRSSLDTREHVQDIREDRYYLKTWNGRSWEEVAGQTPVQEGIEGVSGATMTSMAMAEGIRRRLAAASAALSLPPPPLRFSWRDAGLLLIVLLAVFFAWRGTHGRRWLRRGFQVVVIGYVGFLTGDLLSQSLMEGWVQSGIPWRSAPGLVLLLAAALAVPWAGGRPLYCQHLCPHGALQEWMYAIGPRRWRLTLPARAAAWLRGLPALLVGVVIVVSILQLPFELAHLEPFDAYVVTAAGVITISLALAGLAASLFVPMAYCHYGCPTGALLNFVRSRGRNDRFGRADGAALALLALAMLLSWKYQAIHGWIVAL